MGRRVLWWIDSIAVAVFVDPLFEHEKSNIEGYLWCHMAADSIEELHEFAASIGRKRCWFHRDHYDLTPSFRERAVQYGAIEIGAREMARLVRRDHRGRGNE